MASPPGASAAILLTRQFKKMQKEDGIVGISVGLIDNNIFEWEVMLMLSDDIPLYGTGCFRALLTFPKDYPLNPPKMKFETKIWHPNIYWPSGEVCISILHAPGEDGTGYELASERWSPIQSPTSILLSVIVMLSNPNSESPANVEAAKQLRDDPKEFKRRCRKCVNDSHEC